MDVTYVIPIRVDSLERIENLIFNLAYLRQFNTNQVIIAEIGDRVSNHLKCGLNEVIIHGLDNGYNHRTKIVNQALKEVDTKYVCVIDCDIIVHKDIYDKALSILKFEPYQCIYPWDCITLKIDHSHWHDKEFCIDKLRHKEIFYDKAKGGIFWVDTQWYLKIGGENEIFKGWGAEDEERYYRMKKLGRIYNIDTELYHIDHYRGDDSQGTSLQYMKNIKELNKVKKMTKNQLLDYVNSWS